MKLLHSFLRTFRGTIALAALTGLVSGVSGAALIALINAKLNAGDSGGARLVWSYAGLVALALLSNGLSQYVLVRLAQETSYSLRLRLTREMLAAPLRKLEELGPPKLMAILTEDIPSITAAFMGAPSLCINAATILASLLYLGWLSSAMLVGVIVFLIIGTVVRQALAAKGTRALKLAREEANRLLNHYRALTEGSKELKLHSRRRAAFLDDEIKGVAQKLQRHNLSGLTSYTLAEGWSRLLFYVFFGLILFVLPAIQAVSVEALTGYTLIVIYIMGPFGALLNFVPAISRARIALAHVDQLSHSLTAVTHAERDLSDPKEPALFSDWGRLELRGVTHSYSREGGEDNFTLGPIDLAFSPGEITYLVGGNGGGKTTLAKLIAGLYAPESGEIRLDGCAITEPQRESYRQLFSVIFSDFFLFDSLLGIGGPDLDQRAEDLLVQLRLDRQVAVKNGTLSRTNLSFGQRKRLAWLTAYLEDRPFYVFDEWAAGQDPEFRDLFYLEFLPQLKRRGKTILAITHDEKYFPLADRLIRLDYGRMTETTARASTEHSMVWPLQTSENGFSRKEALYE